MLLLISKIKNTGRTIKKDLEYIGHEVIVTDSLDPPAAVLIAEIIDVILLELLAGANGIERMIRQIKEETRLDELPLVALINAGDIGRIKAVKGLDEVIIYPCNLKELSLRLDMTLRKRQEAGMEDIIKIGGLTIDSTSYEVTIDGSPIPLTHKEFELLKFLAKNSGKVFARQTLVKKIWKHDYNGGMRTVDVHIRRLRAKLGSYSHLITTVKNVGYRFGNPTTSAITG